MSVPHFAALDLALDRALWEGRRGSYLTPPTQPELRALRRWICGQVAAQSLGEDPSPWPGEEVVTWEEITPPVTDVRHLVQMEGPVVAADDTNTIVAVNDAAAALLGYEGPAGLEGRRLVSIVPTRYRQAHLAHYALHLYSGRSLIVGEPMRLPILHRDGREIPVEMVVTSHRLPQERTVFTAAMVLDPL
jgi:PAS domain S-box-containing protein